LLYIRFIVENIEKFTLKEVQESFIGLAGELGLKSEEDVVALCKEVRKEKWAGKRANNS
jgi:hypothetical protein